ncbi:hypothetical protein C8R46DRAFT_1228145 [Mycena filopes]|nr:hypothetical protein C8R46DRAFT_1228145 [Mycena filopes]
MALFPDQRLREALNLSSIRDFRMSAVTTAELKVNRDANQRCAVCDAAAQGGTPLQLCARCKIANYCSKEGKLWGTVTVSARKHKRTCGDPDVSEFSRLWKIMMANPVLASMFMIACIDLFGLIDRPALDQPAFGRVHVGIEPECLTDFFKLYLHPTSGIHGMFQINALTRVVAPTALEKEQYFAMWEKAKAKPYMQNYPAASYVLLLIDIPGVQWVQTSFMSIPAAMFARARSGETISDMSLFHGISQRPLGVFSCLDYINQHIRFDLDNQILLRTKLRDADVQVIRDAAVGKNTMASGALLFKINLSKAYSVRVYERVVDRAAVKEESEDEHGEGAWAT